MRALAMSALLAASTGASFAAGGISCATQGQAVSISVESGVTRGMGSPLFNFSASVEINDARLPDDLRNMRFAREHVPQYWLDHGSLRLRLYREREGDAMHGYLEVAIDTRPIGDEGSFRGRYDITIFDAAWLEARSLSGRIFCAVD